MIEVLYVNNDGGGFTDKVAVEEGTTVSQFLSGRLSGPASNYKIRVNGMAAAFDDQLEQDDRVVATPLKVDGGNN